MLLVKTQTQKPNSQKQLKCSYNLLKSALTRLRSLSQKKKKKLTNFLLDWVKKLTTAFTSDRKEIASGFWTLSFSLSFCRAGKTTWGMCIIIIMADIQTYMHGWANGDLTRHYALKVRFFLPPKFPPLRREGVWLKSDVTAEWRWITEGLFLLFSLYFIAWSWRL